MFLTEGTKLNTTPAISASPTTGWQMLYESEVAWHKLEMGMTRLEHSAIVREDHSLLQEGVKEFFTKAKKWFQWAGQEFLRYLDKVIDTWVNIQNKIRTWLMDVEDLKKKAKNKGIKIRKSYLEVIKNAKKIANSSDAIKRFVDELRDRADKAAEDDDGNYAMVKNSNGDTRAKAALLGSTNSKVKEFSALFDSPGFEKDAYRDATEAEINDTEMLEAINFAKDGRIKCIKTLQYARNSYAKMVNMGIRNSDAENEDVKIIKRHCSAFRETINKWISLINKATNAVISAISNSKKNYNEKKATTGFDWL